MDTTQPPPPSQPPSSQAPSHQNAQVASVAANTCVVEPPVSDLVDIEHFAKVKLRVGRIEAAEAVPKSKKLLKLQVDLGPLGKRQILSGISQFYAPDVLIGKKIIVVANLKPAMMMGQESQGMLLAGSSADGTILRILEPSADLAEGSEVR